MPDLTPRQRDEYRKLKGSGQRVIMRRGKLIMLGERVGKEERNETTAAQNSNKSSCRTVTEHNGSNYMK